MNENAVVLRHITKTFRITETAGDGQIRGGRFYALDDVSLEFAKNSCTFIAGANGSGKSLLMSIIAKLEEATSGSVEVSGKTGLVFQDADSQILGETPREDIAIGVRNQKISKKETAAVVDKALAETGLTIKADFPARFLSGGEKRRLAVAGILAMNVDIIIFDEPFANLDYEGVVQVNRLIIDLLDKEKTVVILTHELEKCFALAEKFVVLYKGKVVFNGSPEDGIQQNLSAWGIHNPLCTASAIKDLLWL